LGDVAGFDPQIEIWGYKMGRAEGTRCMSVIVIIQLIALQGTVPTGQDLLLWDVFLPILSPYGAIPLT
jgi:hypothetical protein